MRQEEIIHNELQVKIESAIDEFLANIKVRYYPGEMDLMYGHVDHNGWETHNIDTDELAKFIADKIKPYIQ